MSVKGEKTMKKIYTEINVEIVRPDSADILTASVTLASAFDEPTEDKASFGDLF